MKEETNTVPAKADGALVPNQSFMYVTGGRKIYRGGNVWDQETDEEFTARIQTDQAQLADLERACTAHPLIIQYAKEGKDFKGVIEGICDGATFREVFKNFGFISWGCFRSMTEYMCPGLKKIFNEALEYREIEFQHKAEEALRKRAIDGVSEPVFTQAGKLAGHRIKFSDRLLEVHLKALDPDKYSEKTQHEVKGVVVSVNMGLRD